MTTSEDLVKAPLLPNKGAAGIKLGYNAAVMI